MRTHVEVCVLNVDRARIRLVGWRGSVTGKYSTGGKSPCHCALLHLAYRVIDIATHTYEQKILSIELDLMQMLVTIR